MLNFFKSKTHFFTLPLLFLTMFLVNVPVYAQSSPILVIDGKVINSQPGPVIEKGRTLVPVRIISEELGAVVSWDEATRKVLIKKDGRQIALKIDSLIFQSGNELINYDVSDVPAKIISDRTFVPLRLISNILGAGIGWNESSRTVTVDSSTAVSPSSYSDIFIYSSSDLNNITGKTSLSLSSNKLLPQNASEVRYYLLNSETRKGSMIARGSELTGTYSWLPETEKQGEKIIFAGLYDCNGNLIKGGASRANISLKPEISVISPAQGKVITETPVSFNVNLNFAPKYIKYELTWLDREKTFTSSEADPFGPWSWPVMYEDNGRISVKATAWDNNNNSWESPPINIEVALEKRLSLGGTKSGAAIQNPITLSTNRNFQVSETQYILRDPLTKIETILHTTGYGSYRWFPKPEDSGNKELYVRVKDTRLTSHTSEPLYVTVAGSPKIILDGIGPNQVVTGSQKLKVSSNVDITDINLYLENPSSGSKKIILQGVKPGEEITWAPSSEDNGNRRLYAEANYKGSKIVSEIISFRVYLGTIYTAKPIIERSSFQNFASGLAVDSAQKTGMSAALQTAQAILETGWGQSVPVDKYTGKFSYNLFGIKGSGPAGSVTSNTWEEYNGTVYRIDAAFRAYSNVNQSWDDHKNLLLKAQRYSIFRDVMHNSTQGAWALRRAGYATDSQYPLKLINIINTYNLNQLDEESF